MIYESQLQTTITSITPTGFCYNNIVNGTNITIIGGNFIFLQTIKNGAVVDTTSPKVTWNNNILQSNIVQSSCVGNLFIYYYLLLLFIIIIYYSYLLLFIIIIYYYHLLLFTIIIYYYLLLFIIIIIS